MKLPMASLGMRQGVVIAGIVLLVTSLSLGWLIRRWVAHPEEVAESTKLTPHSHSPESQTAQVDKPAPNVSVTCPTCPPCPACPATAAPAAPQVPPPQPQQEKKTKEQEREERYKKFLKHLDQLAAEK